MTFQTGFWLAVAATYIYLNIKQARVTWYVAKKLQADGYYPEPPNAFLEWLTPVISFAVFSFVYGTLTWTLDLVKGVITLSLFNPVTTEEMDRMADHIRLSKQK